MAITPLTPQQRKLVELTLQGFDPQVVASCMSIGKPWMWELWAQIKRRAGVNNRAQAIAVLVATGAVVLPPNLKVAITGEVQELMQKARTVADLAALQMPQKKKRERVVRSRKTGRIIRRVPTAYPDGRTGDFSEGE